MKATELHREEKAKSSRAYTALHVDCPYCGRERRVPASNPWGLFCGHCGHDFEISYPSTVKE